MKTIALIIGYIFVVIEFVGVIVGGPIFIVAFLITVFCCITGKKLPWDKR